MKHDNDSQWGPHDALGRMIAAVPYVETAPDLPARIVRSLRPKRLSWFGRCRRWVSAPITVSFKPLTAVMAAGLAIVSGGFYYHLAQHEMTAGPAAMHAVQRVPVLFRFKDRAAQSVSVIGTFNQWDPKGYEMAQDPGTGSWVLRIDLAPGKYDYVFLVDGKALAPDPLADISKADDFGHQSSVIFIKGKNGQTL